MSIEAIDNNLDDRSKRLANWQIAQVAAKSFGSSQVESTKVSTTTSVETEKISGISNSDGDSYQPSSTSSAKIYGKNGKGVNSITFDGSYTKTEFSSDRPPDVTADMSSQLFNNLDENNDHLLETSEYSKESTQRTPKKQETEDN